MSHSGWGKPGWELRDLTESPGQAWVRLAIPISSMHMPLELPEVFCGGKPHLQVLDEMFLQASRNESLVLLLLISWKSHSWSILTFRAWRSADSSSKFKKNFEKTFRRTSKANLSVFCFIYQKCHGHFLLALSLACSGWISMRTKWLHCHAEI